MLPSTASGDIFDDLESEEEVWPASTRDSLSSVSRERHEINCY